MRKTSKALFTATVCLLAIVPAEARTWETGLEGMLDGMVYRYYLPAGYDSSKEYPLITFLHGSGPDGTDNDRQVRNRVGDLIAKTESEYPAIALFPQLPDLSGWNPLNPTDRTDDIIAELISNLSVDTSRLYLSGFSMGGFGAMEYAQRSNAEGLGKHRFAAILPMGGAFLDLAEPETLLADTPIWLMHGGRDRGVSPDFSRSTFRGLTGIDPLDPILFTETRLGNPTAIIGNKRYTELPSFSHLIVEPIFDNNPASFDSTDLYTWMFAQQLVPEPSSLLLVSTFVFSQLLVRNRRSHL